MLQLTSSQQVGDLLKDWRRLNVCFTRAKRKLVVFGSKSSLSTVPILAQFFQLVEIRGWLYSLPSNPPMASSWKSRRGEGKSSPSRLPLSDGANKRKSPIQSQEGMSKKTKAHAGNGPQHHRALLANRPVLRDIMTSQ